MADEIARDSGWLLEPPGKSEIHVHVAVGDETDLSADARSALESLVDELLGAEVSGFGAARCPSLYACTGYICTLEDCTPLTAQPCAFDMDCRIAPGRRFGG